MVASPFVWGAGGQKLTQDQIDNQRKILAALVQRGDPAFNNAGWLGALGRGLEGAYEGWQDSKLKAEQNDLNEYNTNTLGSRLNEVAASLTGGSSMPSAASTGVGQELAATSPSIDPSSISADIKNGIAETASALGIDPVDLATAISYETAGTFDPVKSGPTTQWGQHRGLIQFGEPQAAEYGVDWNNPVGSQLGANGAVANYLRKAGVEPGMGMMDIYSAINAGRVGRYGASDANNGGAPGTVADKVNQQMGGHRANALALFGGQSNPSAAAIETVAPASGYVDPMVSAPNALPSAEVANALVGPSGFDAGRFGGNAPEIYSAASDFVPEQPAPVNVAAAPRVASVPMQVTQNRPPISPDLVRVLSDPRANENTRGVAELLLRQQFAQQQAAQEQDTWMARQNYERQLQANDPLRQAQIAKAQREAANGGETFFGNTVPVQNADGTISYGQIGNQGTFKPIQLPEGQTFAPPTRTVDTGTETILMDQAGNVISRTPKQNREAAAQTAQGSAEGKSTAETTSEYNSIVSKMPGLYGVVDRLSTLANEATYTTAGRALDTARSQLGLQPRDAAVARAEYTAIVDNQILPLLRDTFGAQFTNEEGLRLARTLGDADKTPTEKQALLRAFIEQKERDIQALGARTGQNQTPTQRPQATGNRLRFNPQTGELE